MAPGVPELVKTPLPFLYLLQNLKHLPRTGWLRFIDTPETVASHSLSTAFLGLFAPPPLNRERCMFIGLCHDLAESVVGDIPTYAGVPKEKKHRLEELGFEYIGNVIKTSRPEIADDISNAWLDYEEGRTPEGRYMKQIDKFECLIQAFQYEQRTYGMEEGLEEFQGLCSRVNSPDIMDWLGVLQQERAQHFSNRERRHPLIFVTGDSLANAAQCAELAGSLGIQHINLEEVLRHKSQDSTYVQAGLLHKYLSEQLTIPARLLVDILEQELEVVAKKADVWSLISGFPSDMDQAHEFERRVQIPNYTMVLTSSDKDDEAMNVGKGQTTDLIDHLSSKSDYFVHLGCQGQLNACEAMKEAVQRFIEHNDMVKSKSS